MVPSVAGTVSLSGSTVNNNLTIGANVNSSITWPASPIGGTFTYSGSASSTFPNGFSIGALNQTAGTLVVSASQTLTVTGTGTAWTRSAGTVTANASSTVLFTGAAPDIGGASASTFVGLTIGNGSGTTAATASGNSTVATLTVAAN